MSSFGCIAVVSQMILDILAEGCCILACTGLSLLDLNIFFSVGTYFGVCRQAMAGFANIETKK